MFGDWLKQRRKTLDLTQAELARLAACSPVTIEKIESGQRRPSKQLIDLLAAALKIDPAERGGFALAARAGRAPEPAQPAAPPPRQRRIQNLSAPPTRLIGRESDLAAAEQILTGEGERLLTLTGAPGIGKTRLAMQVAARLAPHFSDGGCFVELGPVDDAAWVPDAMVRALRLPLVDARPAPEQVIDALRNRASLLVLDNFEHVLPAAAFVARLLGECPGLRIIATSREPLRLRAERVLAIPPLALANEGSPATSPAVRLFVERARAVRAGFVLSPDNASDIAALCARLDGLPLAIELVAARAAVLDLGALARDGLPALSAATDGFVDLPARQRTLRDAIGWSYRLLGSDAQRVFRHLAVFAGGADEDALSAALAGEPQPATLGEILAELRDKHLVMPIREARRRAPRWGMLGTLREFGLEQLEAAGERDAVRGRHAAWYARAADIAEPLIGASGGQASLEALAREHDNLRGAFEHLIQADPAGALRLAADLARFWRLRGHYEEGRARLERALAQPAGTDLDDLMTRARALRGLARLAFKFRDVARIRGLAAEQTALARDVARLAPPASDPSEDPALAIAANALFEEGQAARIAGDYAAASQRLKAGLAEQLRREDTEGVAGCYYELGRVAANRGAHSEARDWLEQSAAAYRDADLLPELSHCLIYLGDERTILGEFGPARRTLTEAISLCQRLGDGNSQAMAMYALACLLAYEGRIDESRARYEETLALLRAQGGDRAAIAWTQTLYADVLIWAGAYSRAGEMLDEAASVYALSGARHPILAGSITRARLALALGDATAARAPAERAEALARELGDDDRLAGALGALSALAQHEEDLFRAGELAERRVALLRQAQSCSDLPLALADLAGVRCARQEWSAARGACAEALRIMLETGGRLAGTDCLEHAARALAGLGVRKAAAQVWGAAAALRETCGLPVAPAEAAAHAAFAAGLRQAMAAAAYGRALGAGRRLTFEQAAALAA
jgi:predicted ATPase/DNA-binding XRE family transcriptional regulator